MSKKYCLFALLCGIVFLFKANAQCASAPTPTLTVGDNGSPVIEICSEQYASSSSSQSTFSSGIIKMLIQRIGIDNTFKVTTVQTTNSKTDDTYLSLYSSDGTLLASNDDDTDCDGCLQSTLVYKNTTGAVILNPYIILTKTTKSGSTVTSSCQSIDFNVNIKYRTANDYDYMNTVTSPSDLTCLKKNDTIQFSYTPQPNSTGYTYTYAWSSDDTSKLTIDSSTGLATIVGNSGSTLIKLTKYQNGSPSCFVSKYVSINFPVTSSISPSN